MFGIIEDGTYRVERIGFSTPTLTTGYVVGVRSITREADIPAEGTLFGRWTAADGAIHWDAVEIIEDLHTALQTAAQRGELAVWDVEAGVEIPATAAASRVEYSVRVMTLDGVEEGTTWHDNEDDAWAAYRDAAGWGMGYYRTLADDQDTVIAEGVTA